VSDDAKTRLERIADRDAPLPLGQGYREGEDGELHSTIAKLTEYEIIDRLSAKACHDIRIREDRHVFAEIAKAVMGVTVVDGGRRR